MKKPKVCFDFDGVIHRYSKGYYDGSLYDNPVDGVKDFIDGLKNTYEIIVFTARITEDDYRETPPTDKSVIEDWLKKHDIHFDYITCKKVPAIAYIDDRAIEFNPQNAPMGWVRTLIKLNSLYNEEVKEHMIKNEN